MLPERILREIEPAEALRTTTTALIDRARSHDQEAWRRLVALYTPLIRTWCHRLAVRGDDADDVVQEVFQSVAVSLAKFRPDHGEGSFHAWLRVITRNKLLDIYRQQGAAFKARGGAEAYERFLEVPEEGGYAPDGDDGPARGDGSYQRALERVRSEFGERTWQAFWRAAVDGHAPADIADDLGISAASVRQAKSRVLRRLKELLAEFTPWP